MNTPDENAPPTPADWKMLLSLADTGMAECPWGWSDEWSQAWPEDHREVEEGVYRCSQWLRDAGLV